jgi:1,2-phenylacetyl-CoA epoxidase PaaB subunit
MGARGQMPEYRVFVIDQNNTIHWAAAILTCADDQEALENAKQLNDGLYLEL